jgi:hypothetical protein
VGTAQISIPRPYDVIGIQCYRSEGWNDVAGRAFQKAWKDAGLTCKYISTSYEAKTDGGVGSIVISAPVILVAMPNSERILGCFGSNEFFQFSIEIA